MSKTVLHRAESRGDANHGWLHSKHTFSFGDYYNPERTQFGVLRVLNDDYVAPGKGFGTHPHNDMEIISIPLEGDLEHKDSMGNTSVIRKGDIQVMSAGTGVTHSEYNKNSDRPVKFMQIWIFPREKGLTPRYDQIELDDAAMENNLLQILSPNSDDAGVWIHQDAWFHMGRLKRGYSSSYRLKKQGNGVYLFVLSGSVDVEDIELHERDGLGVWDSDAVSISVKSDRAEILIMEVPMGN
ncbi:pirin family protein [Alkalitalea saponilacus]|uniref:Pirin N-terminal domain-containing protein n=1 Tax=Alkalitalea saponilacus TaxID=889453 RepID=A0A1T5EXD5_9BACT|nr:pirin family protein [Alkalitalea saponilacus]ASB47979.1 hypothetical protein CDL62_01825 [Alkalitalea saponilacus]SKB88603.1 hypothetical protein SAMN03080601_01450 [Alkalitalea saponilacus]